jgi:hypothetical protein
MVDETLAPGESFHVEKIVETPFVPPRLDVCWVIDVSGSFFDDLPNLTANAAAIFNDTIAAAAPGTVRFGLASFSDFPFEP